MSLTGPIILIDDDLDDQFVIKSMLEDLSLPNPLHLFQNGQEGHQYLLTTIETPFLILCDVNMPVMNGLELRKEIDADPYLKNKAIPFVFLSTSANKETVENAYKGTIQGYFKKRERYDDGKENLDMIIKYWKSCLHPNSFK